MGTYLLLRDNKESGPYTLEQLLSNGLKAYDLVWVNGRSAAWRYPSEIEELQPYAPAVEEQPFDRFYKKPDEAARPQPKPLSAVQPVPVQATKPAAAAQTDKSSYEAYLPKVAAQEANKYDTKQPARKSVFVTLPATPIEAYTEAEQTTPVSTEPAPTIKIVENKEAVQTKFSQPLDEIKEQYVKTLLDRKQKISRRTQWMQQLRIAGIMVLLIGGGIFLGWAMSNRGQASDLPSAPRQLALAANQEEPVQQTVSDNTPTTSAGIQEGVVMSTGAEEHVDSDIKAKEARDAAAKEARLRKIIANSPPPTAEEKMLGEVTTKSEPAVAKTQTGSGAKAVMAKADPQRSPVTEEPDSYQRSNTNTLTGERSKSSRDNQEGADNKQAKRLISNSGTRENNSLIASGRDVPREITVLSNNYKRVPFGGIRDLRLTVYNRSDDPLEKVIVEVKYMKPGDQVLKTQWIEFPAIDAKSSATIKMPDTNRGIDVTYQISSVVKAR